MLALNVADVVLTFFGVNFLGFSELNPLAADFPIWLTIVKFSACFIPLICAYVLQRLEIRDYMFVPFMFSVMQIVFYASVMTFNIHSILTA